MYLGSYANNINSSDRNFSKIMNIDFYTDEDEFFTDDDNFENNTEQEIDSDDSFFDSEEEEIARYEKIIQELTEFEESHSQAANE